MALPLLGKMKYELHLCDSLLGCVYTQPLAALLFSPNSGPVQKPEQTGTNRNFPQLSGTFRNFGIFFQPLLISASPCAPMRNVF
jgi:hypothetical protein